MKTYPVIIPYSHFSVAAVAEVEDRDSFSGWPPSHFHWLLLVEMAIVWVVAAAAASSSSALNAALIPH